MSQAVDDDRSSSPQQDSLIDNDSFHVERETAMLVQSTPPVEKCSSTTRMTPVLLQSRQRKTFDRPETESDDSATIIVMERKKYK